MHIRRTCAGCIYRALLRTCSEPALHSSSRIQVSCWRAGAGGVSAEGRAVAPADPGRTLMPPLAKREEERLNDAACRVPGCEDADGEDGVTSAQDTIREGLGKFTAAALAEFRICALD
jgi:hypothetical protein